MPANLESKLFTVQKKKLESEEAYWSLGFNEREQEFWTMKESEIRTNYTSRKDMVANMLILLELDTVTEMRTIYGVFDFLGDVGGLLDLLQLFAGINVRLFAWVAGSNLNIFLIETLFKKDQKRKAEISFTREADPVLDQIRQRNQVKITKCNSFIRN